MPNSASFSKSFLSLLVLISFYSCSSGSSSSPNSSSENRASEIKAPSSSSNYSKVKGQTMGTYYLVTSDAKFNSFSKASIDSILVALNKSLSTYDPNSLISKFNSFESTEPFEIDTHLQIVFQAAQLAYKESLGLFDPTVMPLVNAWGFGPKKEKKPSKEKIEAILELIGFKHIAIQEKDGKFFLIKSKPKQQIDFSAIAKGYGVDVICEWLQKNDSNNFLVDIGGELKSKGRNAENQIWKVAIDKPETNKLGRELEMTIILEDRAIATSGNYRNFYEENGEKFVHTIDPKSGYPKKSRLLSASIFHSSCMMADAYATASMVLGYPEAADWMTIRMKGLSAVLLYSNNKGGIDTDILGDVNRLQN